MIKYGLTTKTFAEFDATLFVSHLLGSLSVVLSLTDKCGDAEGKTMLESSVSLVLDLFKGTKLGSKKFCFKTSLLKTRGRILHIT